MAAQPIYQFYAELEDFEPKIWRRFQVANNITMAKLGYIIMTMYEMQASHLFCFDYPFEEHFIKEMREMFSEKDINKTLKSTDFLKPENKNWHIELPFEDDDTGDRNSTFYDAGETKIKQIIYKSEQYMTFTYDFGDNWQVKLTLEKVFNDKELAGSELPRVLEGNGYGIIEDCGGIPGLEDLAKAFKKKKGSAYKEYSQWLGKDDLDLTAFDIDDMNFRLKKVPRIYCDIYEFGCEPTKRSMDILERKYLDQK